MTGPEKTPTFGGETVANLIWFLHMAFVVMNVLIPFVGTDELLKYHAIVIPFLYLHWVTNEDTCALTVMERAARGCGKERSFFHHLVSPVYKFHQDGVDVFIWLVSFFLWTISMVRVFP
jgi:Na+/H+-dicarboxylate symporter